MPDGQIGLVPGPRHSARVIGPRVKWPAQTFSPPIFAPRNLLLEQTSSSSTSPPLPFSIKQPIAGFIPIRLVDVALEVDVVVPLYLDPDCTASLPETRSRPTLVIPASSPRRATERIILTTVTPTTTTFLRPLSIPDSASLRIPVSGIHSLLSSPLVS